MIIGITGTLAAGKGTIVEFLKEKDFKHYSARGFLIKEIEKRGMPVNRDSMLIVANDLRAKYSSSYIAEQLYTMAKNDGGNCVLESLRTPGEIYALKEKDEFYLFAVDADKKLRYNRAMLRSNESDNVTFEKFILQEEKETTSNNPSNSNVRKCIELADYKFENNGTLEELKNKVEKVLEEINSKKKVYKINEAIDLT
jgi:dephospho-CoA kinase